ncbi:hypothetical protein [Acidilobus sp.]|uniref:hypothetical protein n=1 Tax=Acidilobus sp. TaxID=1872109 RepID=UPI003D0884B4
MYASSGKLSIGEEAYLRALTGRLVGIGLFKGFNRIAVIPYPDRICESIAAAAATAYLDTYGYGPGKVAFFDYADNMDDVAKRIVAWGAEAVYIAFGGEQRMSDVAKMVLQTLKSLRSANYRGSLLIHVRAWLATKQFSTITSDPDLREYLRSLKEIRLFTADANSKKFFFHTVNVAPDGSMSLAKYMEIDITDEHANLLKLSLPPQ